MKTALVMAAAPICIFLTVLVVLWVADSPEHWRHWAALGILVSVIVGAAWWISRKYE